MTIKEAAELYFNGRDRINSILELEKEILKTQQRPYTGDPIQQEKYCLRQEQIGQIFTYLDEYVKIIENKLEKEFKR